MPVTIIPKLERIGVEGSMTALSDDAFDTIPQARYPRQDLIRTQSINMFSTTMGGDRCSVPQAGDR
jgi:hypothetical protein